MLKPLFLGLITVASPAYAQDLPRAISCYQNSTNAKDINAYMACFIEEAEMTDVSRSFSGQKAIAAWAEREVIPYGETFQHREILELSVGYAKTEVTWLSWIVHYSYWWDREDKITRMSLQYAN